MINKGAVMISSHFPSAQFTFDVNKSTLFKMNNENKINILGVEQLNTLKNVSLLDIFLSTNQVVEPHYHQNAAELVYCIAGSAAISLLNPNTKQIQTYTITPGQVVNIPQGWWHYEVAIVDHTHLLAIFDAPTPEVILGSDILKFTPPHIMAHTYCIDESLWKETIAPITPSTYIGPSKGCRNYKHTNPPYHPNMNSYNWYMNPFTHYPYSY